MFIWSYNMRQLAEGEECRLRAHSNVPGIHGSGLHLGLLLKVSGV